LCEQRRDLVVGQWRDAATARHAGARSQIAHAGPMILSCMSAIIVTISPGRSKIA
jgi:hypothetical protein